MNDLTCPYCEKKCVPSEDLYEQETSYEHECEHCGKYFSYSLEYYPYYTSNQAPCMNGGEHDFREMVGCPEEYFENMYRCAYCGEERRIG